MRLNISKEIFRAYDIRGQYPEQINEELYNLLGKALGTKILQVSKTKKGNELIWQLSIQINLVVTHARIGRK